LEVIGYQKLSVAVNSRTQAGTYQLRIWSYHVDNSGTELWSVKATPMTITIIGYTFCSLELLDQTFLRLSHNLTINRRSQSFHNFKGKVETSTNCSQDDITEDIRLVT